MRVGPNANGADSLPSHTVVTDDHAERTESFVLIFLSDIHCGIFRLGLLSRDAIQ